MTAEVAGARRAWFVAVLAVALALGWQALAVHYNYEGNWTSLFCTGASLIQPPSLASENLYRFPNFGYDGQYYHYVAHDPFFRHGLARYIDAPRLRYRRILAPGLAYLAAGGQPAGIDMSFIAVNLLFLFAGVYWLSRYVARHGYSVLWGLLYLAVPAVVVSIDRLTVDMALTALCMGFALYVEEDRPAKLYAVLMLAPLARETGMFLTAACTIGRFVEHRVRDGIVLATSAIAALAWYSFVQIQTTPYDTRAWFTRIPLAGLIDRMAHPPVYHFAPIIAWTATALDEVALAGMLFSFLLALWLLRVRWIRPMQIAVALIAISGLNLGKPFWEEAYAFARVFSPLLVLLALYRCTRRSWVPLLPLAMTFPRVGMQLGGQVIRVVHGIFR